MSEDIRDRVTISHSDIVALNFIRSSTSYIFRKHFRQGLRSRIIEILDPADVRNETEGIEYEGIRQFPKAIPCSMLRIFRTCLESGDEAWAEIERFKVVSQYLAPDFLAHSYEFIVDYLGPKGYEPMLCGFQEYIDGEVVDPWSILDREELLSTLYNGMRVRGLVQSLPEDEWLAVAGKKAAQFIDKIKRMVINSGYIPDLAGVGNLRMKAGGEICLVDLNNISAVSSGKTIPLDEKGYPVADKSIESLSLIEEKIVGSPIDMEEAIYQRFLGTQRRRLVEEKMELFNRKIEEDFNELSPDY